MDQLFIIEQDLYELNQKAITVPSGDSGLYRHELRFHRASPTGKCSSIPEKMKLDKSDGPTLKRVFNVRGSKNQCRDNMTPRKQREMAKCVLGLPALIRGRCTNHSLLFGHSIFAFTRAQ